MSVSLFCVFGFDRFTDLAAIQRDHCEIKKGEICGQHQAGERQQNSCVEYLYRALKNGHDYLHTTKITCLIKGVLKLFLSVTRKGFLLISRRNEVKGSNKLIEFWTF